MDVRIGVTHAPREINVEMDDGIDRQQLKADVAAALTDDDAVLWLTDKRGRDIGIPSSKVAYIEIGTADNDRKIGFGG